MKKIIHTRTGWIFIFVSTILWIVPLASPFLPLSTAMKVGVAGITVVLAEVLFWLGAVIVGKEAVQKYRKSLLKFLKRKKEKDEQS
jgi:hypothetical protein